MIRAALVAALALAGSCSDGTASLLTGPFTSDVLSARAAWLAYQPANYAFETTSATEWGPPGAYSGENDGTFYRVTVEGGQVTAYRDAFGKPVNGTAESIEQGWQRILAAQQNGSLKMAKFASNGVPVEWFIDKDSWADDAVRTFVRSFSKQ